MLRTKEDVSIVLKKGKEEKAKYYGVLMMVESRY